MRILSWSIIFTCGVAISSLALTNASNNEIAKESIDTLYQDIANMTDQELANALNLSEENGDYILTGLVDKAKSLLDSARSTIESGFSWVMCKTIAKLNPLTTFLCDIPNLQKSNSSAQGYFDSLKRAFGIK